MWFFFEMYFHFQNVKGFVSVVFPFSEKHNCKQKSVHSLQIALLMRLWTNNEIYIKLLNLFQLSRIYHLLYHTVCNSRICSPICINKLIWKMSDTYLALVAKQFGQHRGIGTVFIYQILQVLGQWITNMYVVLCVTILADYRLVACTKNKHTYRGL